MRFQYLTIFISILIPLIASMIVFPLVICYLEEETAWILANLLIVLIGIIMGMLTSFLGALGNILGHSYTGPLMQGYQMSFVLVAFVRLICLLPFNSQDSSSYIHGTILYFSINVAVLTLMLISVPLSY